MLSTNAATTLEQCRALVERGYKLAFTPPGLLANSSTSFGATFDFAPPTNGNVALVHPKCFALRFWANYIFQDAKEHDTFRALMALANTTQVIRLGRRVWAVWRLAEECLVTEGPIRSGPFSESNLTRYWHVPPTSIFEDGYIAAEYVGDFREPQLLNNDLVAELKRRASCNCLVDRGIVVITGDALRAEAREDYRWARVRTLKWK